MIDLSTKGTFINFELNYKKLNNQEQAKAILDKTKELVANNTKGVAITYSANYGQTRDIERVYLSGGWNTQTGGANQAAVIQDMENLLASTYQHLQGKIHIVPISTMNAYSTPAIPWNDDVHMGIVITDLDRIQNYLKDGWSVLGWQNQDTVSNPVHPYAVGGGVASTFPKAISDKVQKTLISYAGEYKNNSDD